MTRSTNARLAGAAFLLYIVVGAAPAPNDQLRVIFTLLSCFSALLLAVTLYALTRAEDQDIALFGFACRVAEGVLGAMFIPARLALQTAGTPELQSFYASARSWNPIVGATFFAVGSAAFAWLLLRGRVIPTALAWLGVISSVLLVIGLPLQLTGVLTGSITKLMWIPMALFEIPLGFWLLIKGVNEPRAEAAA